MNGKNQQKKLWMKLMKVGIRKMSEPNNIDYQAKEEELVETFFFDTCALVEIVKGSENYKKYIDTKIVTTLLNLMEFHYSTMQDLGNEKAVVLFNELKQFTVDFDKEDVINANLFKYQQNKKHKKISYIDALGYVIALGKGIKFLTGDKDFEDVEFVEYVKG